MTKHALSEGGQEPAIVETWRNTPPQNNNTMDRIHVGKSPWGGERQSTTDTHRHTMASPRHTLVNQPIDTHASTDSLFQTSCTVKSEKRLWNHLYAHPLTLSRNSDETVEIQNRQGQHTWCDRAAWWREAASSIHRSASPAQRSRRSLSHMHASTTCATPPLSKQDTDPLHQHCCS
jgi:hypothetical protein